MDTRPTVGPPPINAVDNLLAAAMVLFAVCLTDGNSLTSADKPLAVEEEGTLVLILEMVSLPAGALTLGAIAVRAEDTMRPALDSSVDLEEEEEDGLHSFPTSTCDT